MPDSSHPSAFAPARRGTLARIWPWARAVITLGILVSLVHQVMRQWHTVASLSFRLAPLEVAASFLLNSCALFGLCFGMLLTLRLVGLGRNDAPVAFYFRLWLEPYFYRYVPGKVMLVAERIRLGRAVGIEASAAVVLVLWESVLLLVSASLVGLLTLSFARVSHGDVSPYLAGGLILSVALLVGFPRVLSHTRRIPWLHRRVGNLSELRLRYTSQLLLTLLYAGVWICFGCGFFFTARIFMPLGFDVLPIVVFWFVAGFVVGFVTSVAPAGLGVREGFIVLGLSSLMPPGQAVALAVAGRLWLTVIEVLWIGLACLIPKPNLSLGNGVEAGAGTRVGDGDASLSPE